MTYLHLLSGGAADGLVKALAPGFEAETGASIRGQFGAVGAMREKLGNGHHADVVILTRPIIDDLSRIGAVMSDTVADIGRVRTGVAVRAGDPPPPMLSADDLKKALLAADEIYIPDPVLATAGIHFAGVMHRLGIAEEVAGSLRVHPNGATAMRALAASASARPIGCTQVTEIVITPGVVLVAPLPEGLGLETVYSAAVCKDAQHPGLALRLVKTLAGEDAAPQRERCGFE